MQNSRSRPVQPSERLVVHIVFYELVSSSTRGSGRAGHGQLRLICVATPGLVLLALLAPTWTDGPDTADSGHVISVKI